VKIKTPGSQGFLLFGRDIKILFEIVLNTSSQSAANIYWMRLAFRIEIGELFRKRFGFFEKSGKFFFFIINHIFRCFITKWAGS